MAGETPPPTVIALAMHNKHLVSNPDKKIKGVGLSVTGVQPTLDAIDRLFGESQSGAVVLNALHYQGEASAIAVGIARSRPGIKVFILGGGLFARAWAELPIPTCEEDSYRTPSGRRLTTDEAIEQCHQFDIRGDQLAQYLHVPSEHVERVTKKWRVAREPSIQARRLPSMRVMGAVLAIAVAVGALIVAVSRMPGRHAIAGEVTYQGKPVPFGLIRFTPQGQGESTRPSVTGEIQNGKYKVKSGHGSYGGAYRVQVSGFDGIPKFPGPLCDPRGSPLFPDVTRTVDVPCSAFTFNVKCD